MWKAALIRCIISWFCRICFPHVQRSVSLNTACPHEGHWWISEVLNSMSSTFSMSWAAWVDSWLNSMLSFTGSSRIQIFFEPSISLVHFKDVFRTVLNFRWVLAFLPLSQKNSVRLCARSGLLLLALPILAQRYLARWPWSFKSFVKVLDLHHLMPHDQCNLQVLLRRSWLQTTSSARIPIQDPSLLTIVGFQDVIEGPFCGTVRSLWALSSSGSFPKWFVGVKKTAWRALSFSFPPGINLYSKTDWQSHERPLWSKCFFQCWESRMYPIEFGSTAIPLECPWIARK